MTSDRRHCQPQPPAAEAGDCWPLASSGRNPSAVAAGHRRPESSGRRRQIPTAGGQNPAAATDKVDRPISTAIYFLLPTGSFSHLHRIPCAETWHFYKGEPLTVFELHDGGEVKFTILGTDLESGQLLQYTVPPNTWFGSFPTKDVESYAADGSSLALAPSRDPDRHYSLVGCTCAPAFQFEDFEMAKYDGIAPLAPEAEPFIRYLTF